MSTTSQATNAVTRARIQQIVKDAFARAQEKTGKTVYQLAVHALAVGGRQVRGDWLDIGMPYCFQKIDRPGHVYNVFNRRYQFLGVGTYGASRRACDHTAVTFKVDPKTLEGVWERPGGLYIYPDGVRLNRYYRQLAIIADALEPGLETDAFLKRIIDAVPRRRRRRPKGEPPKPTPMAEWLKCDAEGRDLIETIITTLFRDPIGALADILKLLGPGAKCELARATHGGRQGASKSALVRYGPLLSPAWASRGLRG